MRTPRATHFGRRVDSGRAVPYLIEMCIICLDFQKGRLTSKEARRALGEMTVKIGREHAAEVERAITQAERDAAADSSATPATYAAGAPPAASADPQD